MTETDKFCSKCIHDCCHIYENTIDEQQRNRIRNIVHKNGFSSYGVESLYHKDTRCEFFGSNGCIIERSKRPEVCLKYECKELIEFKRKLTK